MLRSSWALWLLVGACEIDLSVIPVGTGSDGGGVRGDDAGAAHDAGPSRDADASGERADGALAMPSDGGDAGDDTVVERIRHESCERPRPPKLPPEPRFETDATGRPLFDLYRDLDCDALLAYPLCHGNDCPGAASCLQLDESSEGVCTGLRDPFGGFGAEPFSFAGRCVVSDAPEVHARACCAQVAGVDCRAWPYPQNSKPDELCARHDDCEPGLLCKDRILGGGLCTCPEDEQSGAPEC